MSLTPHLTLTPNRQRNQWQIIVYWPDTKERTRRSLPVTLDDDPGAAYEDWKRNALPILIANHDRAVEAATTDKANPTLKQVFDWFLDVNLPLLGRAEKTVQQYTRVLDDFRAFAGAHHVARVQQLSWPLFQQFQLWLATLRPRANTTSAQHDRLVLLRQVFDEATDAGIMPEALNIKWKIPPKPKSTQFEALSLDETRTFYAALQEHAPAIYDPTWWMYLTGWLPSDTLDLRLSQIDLTARRIDRFRAKTGAKIALPINDAMLEVIQRNLHRRTCGPQIHDPLFLDPKRRPWEYHAYKKRLEYFCTRHKPLGDGIQVNPRDLRKTFATHLARAGENPKVLQHLLNHANIEMTLAYYVDIDTDDLLQATNRHLHRYHQTTENPRDPSQHPHSTQ